jgi:hypothetical protein
VLEGTAQATGPVPGGPSERDAFDHDVISGATSGVLRRLQTQLQELRSASDAGTEPDARGS